jgi:hypothetical protein
MDADVGVKSGSDGSEGVLKSAKRLMAEAKKL